jgi:GNAT superfamily N-acetyltransferase
VTAHASDGTAFAAVRALSAREARERIAELSAILVDCVDGGASVSFMAPLSRDKADRFWHGVADGVAAGDRTLLVAEDRKSGEMIGTVQVLLRFPENQPHRGEVAKMLVQRAQRKRGVGAALMRAAEDVARSAGKTLLVLDTASDDAERLYERLGWTRVGVVPEFALLPDGRTCSTTFYYRSLNAVAEVDR